MVETTTAEVAAWLSALLKAGVYHASEPQIGTRRDQAVGGRSCRQGYGMSGAAGRMHPAVYPGYRRYRRSAARHALDGREHRVASATQSSGACVASATRSAR